MSDVWHFLSIFFKFILIFNQYCFFFLLLKIHSMMIPNLGCNSNDDSVCFQSISSRTDQKHSNFNHLHLSLRHDLSRTILSNISFLFLKQLSEIWLLFFSRLSNFVEARKCFPCWNAFDIFAWGSFIFYHLLVSIIRLRPCWSTESNELTRCTYFHMSEAYGLLLSFAKPLT